MDLPALLVSDLAGTVLRDDGAVLAAYRRALRAHAIPFDEADLAARRGANKQAVFAELAGRAHPPTTAAELAGRALATFEAALREQYADGPIEEVAGATAALGRLREAGVALALTSGLARELVELLVRRMGWAELFGVALGGEDAPAGRPAPYLIYRAMMALGVHDAGRVAVVGDTALDLRAGANARAGWVIGVLSGAHDAATLGAAPHTHLLPSVAALPDLFGLAPAASSAAGARDAGLPGAPHRSGS